MALTVEIDKSAGFCGGVIRAIGTAERFLDDNPDKILYTLGPIVHNEQELSRLRDRGIRSVYSLDGPEPPAGGTLLIRAHGEPPRTYNRAEERGLQVIDCTCPVVLKLQSEIRKAYEAVGPEGGKIIIFGKIGHAEVLGLVGQVQGDAIVVESLQMLERLIADGTIRTDVPLEIFSQTTKDPGEYSAICGRLRQRCAITPVVHETICRQVVSRHKVLAEFAAAHSVVVFVSGKESSNGRVLSGLCRSVNPRTYVISSPEEIDTAWFIGSDSVGVSGATSTPAWLLEKVVSAILKAGGSLA